MDALDLEKNVLLREYDNFTIGIQYSPTMFDFRETDKTTYDYYVNLLVECSNIYVYNFKSKGFGTEVTFGGESEIEKKWGFKLNFTKTQYDNPKLNNYNYYE